MSWVDWEMTDLDGGYMYCCDLEEAAAALQEVSSLGLAPSSGLLQIPTTPTTTTSTTAPPACSVNLDQLSGRYPPMLTRDYNFIYPVEEEGDGTRLLKFGTSRLNFFKAFIYPACFYCFSKFRFVLALTTIITRGGRDIGPVLPWQPQVPGHHHSGGQ